MANNTDWTEYFDCVDNLGYRVLAENGKTYLLTESIQIDLNEIPDFYNMKGSNLDEPEWQKARYRRGYWLELAVQVALRKAQISFKGNSMNLNHYPHSKGLHVDMDTDNLLIEATNLVKWLGFDGMQEKINYFLKADPKHRKKWILVSTFIKCIPKQIRQQIANNDITLILTDKVANSRNHNVIAEQLVQPLINLNKITNNNHEPLTKDNLTNRYQTTTLNSLRPIEHVCGLLISLKSSGLDG